MTETAVKMQLVSDGKAVRIDIEGPDGPLSDEDKTLIREETSVFREVPAARSVVFRDREPTTGNPFTEINCGDIHTGVEEIGLKLDEVNLAREIAGVLEQHGTKVVLDPYIKPIEQSGYMFLGTTAMRP